MKKISTVQTFRKEIFKAQRLTIGLDLGDHWSWRSSLLGDPGSKFLYGKLGKAGRQKKEQRKKERKRDDIQTAELDRRDQVTATKSWPNFPSKEGNRGRLLGSSTY